ncbi:MAG: DUF2142 domain-containing protein, partial [Propionibacteriaceae bacterium]|nr:DUF2142 domain-containing protein [Propionibacteriaceae bacterium]
PRPLSPTALQDTWRHNEGQYPGGYYYIMHIFTSNHFVRSVWTIRMANALLSFGLFAALLCLLPAASRRLLVYTAVATFVPLVFYIVTSVNPSAWGIMGVVTAWFGLQGAFVASSRGRRIALGALAVFGTVLAALSRSDCAAMCAVAAASVIVLHWPTWSQWRQWAHQARQWRQAVWQVGAVAVVLVVAVVGFFSGAQHSALSSQTATSQSPHNDTALELLWHNIQQLPSLLGQMWQASLGYPDFSVSALAGWLPMIAAFGLLFWGLRRCNWRKVLALVGVGAAMCALPLYMAQSLFSPLTTSGIQGRYMAPLVIVFFAIAMMRRDASGAGTLSWPQTVTALLLVAAGNALALYTLMRRYITGLNDFTINLDAHVQWWPSGVPSPMLVWVLGSLGFAAALLCLVAVRRAHDAIPREIGATPAQERLTPSTPSRALES